MSLSEVSNVLWRERFLLELLAFKLEEEQLVAASQRGRWVDRAAHEVEVILGEIKRMELERAVAAVGARAELGLEDPPSLRELAAVGPPPWNRIFADHRRALLTLAEELAAFTEPDGDLPRGHRAARTALAALEDLDTHGRPIPPSGRWVRRSVDESV